MAISAYFGHPEIPRPNFHVQVLATASPGIDLVKSLAFRVSLQQFLTKKMKKMAKKWPEMTKNGHYLAIFQFFSKNTGANATKTPLHLLALHANIFSKQ